jgi:hypothetical protein
MAAKNFGTVHLYGINGTITSATVQSFSKNETHALEDETMNEDGQVIELLLDDVRIDATIGLRIQAAYTESVIGATLTYDTVEYIIMGKNRSEGNKQFREIEYTLKKYEYCASS